MDYKLPPQKKPEIVIERSFKQIIKEDIANNDPLHSQASSADNFGGLFVTSTGNANASMVSPSAPSDEYVVHIPQFGVIPEVEIERQQIASNMELTQEITPQKTTNKQRFVTRKVK